ncbi:anthrone oxygenase family protein [Streptomyces sp. NPDC087300]|uniref:anthrone oxygenase family protein n=1 Tax=Streptomyces sp. NPDC087300 TaxID=3365780 RepID=UPI0037F8CF3B
MLTTLEVLTTVVVGVMVGVEFSVAFVMNRILDALPEDSGQLGHAHGGRMLGRVMPFWYIGSLVLAGAWATAGRHDAGTGLVVTAAGLLILSVVMSVLLLVPINNRNRTWTPENRPADWKRQLDRWGRFHYVRLAVILAAFAFLATALTR